MKKSGDYMMKIVGAILILCGCCGLGRKVVSGYRDRVDALQELCNILELMAGEIHYERSSLPQCCERVAPHLHPPFSATFRRISERMKENQGVSFAGVFRQETADALKQRPLRRVDREKFWEFTETTGFADSDMQVRALRRSVEHLKEEKQKLLDEEKEKGRVVRGLSIMSGLLIVLILW